MDISAYFKPLDKNIFDSYGDQKTLLGNVVAKFLDEEKFPDLTDCKIVIIGVPEDRNAPNNFGCGEAPDKIREKFYRLKAADHPYNIVDLGNLRIGQTVNDTYA